MEIIPAIIGKDFSEIKNKIESVKDHVRWVQIDVMDGKFAASKNWPYNGEGKVSDLDSIECLKNDKVKIEAHLMVEDPENYIEEWVEYGADRIIIHVEATKKMGEIMAQLEESETELGVALKLETPISVLKDYAGELDTIQLMSIAEIGYYGHGFEKNVLSKIRVLRAKYPGVTIAVDGGVNLENAKSILDAGADNLVIGSAIFDAPEISTQIEKFSALGGPASGGKNIHPVK